ncbi:MAG: RsmG family class I SAM-dependent methyltransferase [Acidimicrobiales bacterium]
MAVSEQLDHGVGFCRAVEMEFGRSPDSVLDLGTGGGVPGLVMPALWPGCDVVLLDGNQRRTDFLEIEVDRWGISDRVTVARERAEEAGRKPEFRGSFEVVTARSFATPAVTAECGAPFLEIGGLLVVSEPPDGISEERWPAHGVGLVGLVPVSTYRYDGRYGYQILEKRTETPDRYPRRTGIPAKRHLF